MKKTAFLLLAIMTSQLLSAQKLVTYYYDWNKVHPSEQFYVNSAGQKNGSYKQYDQSGVVLKEYNYLNGAENGLCIDYAIGPDNKRVVQAKSNFVNGQPEGYFVEYCRYSGYTNKIQEGQNKNGKKTGLWKVWWCDDDTRGVLKTIGSYKNDNQVGEWKTYSRNGSILTKGSYNNDNRETGRWSYYLPSDSTKPISSGNYINGVKVGEWTLMITEELQITDEVQNASAYRKVMYDSSGRMQTGSFTDFYLTGEKFREGSFNQYGKETGVDTRYYKSGKILAEQNFATGTYKEYYESGKIRREGKYAGDKETGKWNSYYESGKVLWDEYYTEGQITTSYKYAEDGELIGAYVLAYGFYTPRDFSYEELLEMKAQRLALYIIDYTGTQGKFVMDFSISGRGLDYFGYLREKNEPANLPPLVAKNADGITSVLELNTEYSNTKDKAERSKLMKQIIAKLEKMLP